MRKMIILTLTMIMMLAFNGMAFAADTTAIAGPAISVVDFNFAPTTYAEEPRQLPLPVPIFPPVIPLIQGGRVGDVTKGLPEFAYVGLRPIGPGDKVVDLVVNSGRIFGRVRLEDIELDLIKFYKETINKKKWNETKVRFAVQYKDSAMGAGIGGGGSASISNIAGSQGVTGALAILPGYNRSTADPMYILKLYLIGDIASLNIKAEIIVPAEKVKVIKQVQSDKSMKAEFVNELPSSGGTSIFTK
jgi:hypothetical protein